MDGAVGWPGGHSAEFDVDEPAVGEPEKGAVAVTEQPIPPPVVSTRQAGHQRRLDPAAMAHEELDIALVHLLDCADPDDPMRLGNPGQSPAVRDELGVADVRLRPRPLLVEFDSDLRGQLVGILYRDDAERALAAARR